MAPKNERLESVYRGVERLGFPTFVALFLFLTFLGAMKVIHDDLRIEREAYRTDSKEERKDFQDSLRANTVELRATAEATKEVAVRTQQTNDQLGRIETLLGKVLTRKAEVERGPAMRPVFVAKASPRPAAPLELDETLRAFALPDGGLSTAVAVPDGP